MSRNSVRARVLIVALGPLQLTVDWLLLALRDKSHVLHDHRGLFLSELEPQLAMSAPGLPVHSAPTAGPLPSALLCQGAFSLPA